MASKTFSDWLKDRNFKDSLKTKSGFTAVVGWFDEIVAALQRSVPHKNIIVRLEPGGLVTLGQQYRFNVALKDGTYSRTLFRAYVPVDGARVVFDFYDEQPTTVKATQEEVFDAVSKFLVRETTIAQFQQLADLLERKGVKS